MLFEKLSHITINSIAFQPHKESILFKSGGSDHHLQQFSVYPAAHIQK